MSTPDFESKAEYIRRMADDGLGDLASQSEVEANISASFAQLGTVVSDESLVPVSATIRPAGSFTDADSLHRYLEDGGLVVTDGAGNVEPIGFVWIVESFDDILFEITYQVYIDEDTQ